MSASLPVPAPATYITPQSLLVSKRRKMQSNNVKKEIKFQSSKRRGEQFSNPLL